MAAVPSASRRARDDLGAVVRAHVLFVCAHDAVDRLARHELLLDQQGLERADAERQDRLRLVVMVSGLSVGTAHDVLLAGAAGSRYRSQRSMWTGARGSAESPHRTAPSKRTL